MSEPRSLAQRLRQHHAIEHATVTLLSQRRPDIHLLARSDLQGFVVYGDIETAVLRETAAKAVEQLQAGQVHLAVHPNCGTNLVTSGVLSATGALLFASGRRRPWWDRLPGAILGATFALIAAVPLGRWVQAHLTTDSNVNDLRILDVTRVENSRMNYHRVTIG